MKTNGTKTRTRNETAAQDHGEPVGSAADPGAVPIPDPRLAPLGRASPRPTARRTSPACAAR